MAVGHGQDTRTAHCPAGGGAATDATPANPPLLRILLSEQAVQRHADRIAQALHAWPHRLMPVDLHADGPTPDGDVAFLSRDVTGLSTKYHVLPNTQRFYNALLNAPSLRWLHIHSAGTDRPVYQVLQSRGVHVSTSSGSNAEVVAQTALAGVLALSRRFPQLWQAHHDHRWTPLIGGAMPRDLAGQQATVLGWGPIGQSIARYLQMLGLRVAIVRQRPLQVEGVQETATFEAWQHLLPATDWLVLACPLTACTRHIINRQALALLPAHACVVNVARGDVVEEASLVDALAGGRLAGAFLDVFTHEPLDAASPIWNLPNVIATPHSAGTSDGNAERVLVMFLKHLLNWLPCQSTKICTAT